MHRAKLLVIRTLSRNGRTRVPLRADDTATKNEKKSVSAVITTRHT